MSDTNPLTRDEYSSPAGIVRFWTKDGAWHVARPNPLSTNRDNFFWTDESYRTRDEAIVALEVGAA